MNFHQANEYCTSMDAFLAEPRTLEEYDIIHDYTKSLSTTVDIWLGATDSDTEGTWLWQSDGEHLTYNKWRSGHPPANDDKDCLFMGFTFGKFGDARCIISSYNFLCQRKVQGIHVFFFF